MKTLAERAEEALLEREQQDRDREEKFRKEHVARVKCSIRQKIPEAEYVESLDKFKLGDEYFGYEMDFTDCYSLRAENYFKIRNMADYGAYLRGGKPLKPIRPSNVIRSEYGDEREREWKDKKRINEENAQWKATCFVTITIIIIILMLVATNKP